MKITVEDFENILGVELSADARKIVNNANFEYTVATPEEYNEGIKEYIHFLTEYKQASGPEYLEIWEKGWQQNLESFMNSGEMSDLIPKFVRGKQMKRFKGSWISPMDPEFETNFVMVLRDAIFRENFTEASSIWEFGSGTGLNLVHLSQILPGKSLFGCDWAKSSIQILEELNRKFNLEIRGFHFDLFHPSNQFSEKIADNSGLFTIGTMEQLGQNYQPFLDFILTSNFKRIVHIETNYELYDESNLLDYLAIKYIEKRNWLKGYFSTLKNLEKLGRIKVIKERKTFGSFFHDGYTITVWENLRV